MTREQILEKLRENYDYLSSVYGLKRIGLFGSYAVGTQNESSDIDIMAEFDRPIGLKFMEFTEYLERLFGTKLDVITPAGMKGIRSPKIIQSIRETIIYV